MYKVDTDAKQIARLLPKTFTELHLLERFDIQEWIAQSPEILGEDLLVIAKELDLPSRIRIDLLAIDRMGNLVVIELKRDESGSAVEWQAIKYASYCSNFLPEDVFSYYARYLEADSDEAQLKIEEFMDEELSGLNQGQRIVLVAREFHSDVASAVLWLRDFEVDIKCVRLRPYVDENNDLFITPDTIIPLPEAKDYVQRKESKRREQKQLTTVRSSFSLEKGDFDGAELKRRLRATLARQSDLTPRFVRFLEILLSAERVFGREEVKQRLFERGIGSDYSQTGRYLSNISQFLTKKSNPHLRQMIAFTSGGPAGETKDDYRLLTEYRGLVKEAVDEWNMRNQPRVESAVPETIGDT